MPPPKAIGPYEVIDELGRGAMGLVFRGRHRESGIVRAVKVLLGGADQEALTRFRREAETLARVGGALVVAVHEAGVADGHLYLAMDLMPGGSLRGRLKGAGKLPWREACAIAAKIAASLERCHTLGIVHRDVKPENILFDDGGLPRLSDFGVARDAHAQKLTATGTFLGTPAYMPPEMLQGKPADEGADVFSLAVVLYELLTGRHPHPGATWIDVYNKASSGERDPLGEGVPAELEDFLDRALAVDPSQRPQTARAFREALEAILAPTPKAAPAPRPVGALVLLGALAVTALGLVGLLLLAVFGRRPPAPPAAPPAPVAPPAPARRVPPPPPVRPRDAHEKDAPAWWEGVPPGLRPRLPLPPGLRFGEAPREYVNVKDGSVLVFVPRARFHLVILRGGFDKNEETPLVIDVDPFFIGKYEVTNARFAEFVKATGHQTMAARIGTVSLHMIDAERPDLPGQFYDHWGPSKTDTWDQPQGGYFPDRPVVHVAWEDAIAYAKWAGLAVPTCEQWQTAALYDPVSQTTRPFPWGDEPPPGPVGVPTEKTPDGKVVATAPHLANLKDQSLFDHFKKPCIFRNEQPPMAIEIVLPSDRHPFAAPVGSFPRDVSAVGAYDLCGNVSEWVETRKGEVPDAPLTRDVRTHCGYAWDTLAVTVDLRRRRNQIGADSRSTLGFRICRPEK